MFEPVIVGAAAFVSTNIDDILLLALFFGQPRRSVAAVVAGQYLGIGALVLVSVIAALAALVVPSHWLALLGLLPIGLGIRQLLQRQTNDANAVAPSGAGLWTVAGVTVANGGDNLGVYIPLFASQTSAIPVYVVVFAIGTAVWCVFGAALVRHPAVGTLLARYGHRILPWVLIGIGGYVLSDFWRG